jgi:hypothetical protein
MTTLGEYYLCLVGSYYCANNADTTGGICMGISIVIRYTWVIDSIVYYKSIVKQDMIFTISSVFTNNAALLSHRLNILWVLKARTFYLN